MTAAREAAMMLDKMETEDQDNGDGDDATADPDVHVSSRQLHNIKKKPDTVMLELPRKGLAKALTPMAGRMHMSTRQSFGYTAQVIKAGKGQVSDFAISKSIFHSQRKSTEKELAAKLMDKFRKDHDVKFLILHWDGKKVKLLNRTVQEHLPILLQAVGSERPPIFIGAPQIESGTGEAMKDKLIEYLAEYSIEKCIGMCFDTTASNTRVNKGAAALLEHHLHKALLWFACRHHVAELHMGWADDAVRHALG